jgi:predicted molibdopterin-dependent oxidoreductase YjgC
VLPAAAATEVDGTFTNLEGRVSVCEQKVTPCGTARSDWMIAAQIALRLGHDLGIDSPAAARAELAGLSAVHGHLTEAALHTGGVEGVLCSGNGSIAAPAASGSNGPANDAYSLRLVATRRMYDAGTTLSHSPSSAGLARSIELRLNPADFDKLGVEAGSIVQLISNKGELMTPVIADPGVPAGSAAIPANSPGANANQLIDASQPVTDVRVERS